MRKRLAEVLFSGFRVGGDGFAETLWERSSKLSMFYPTKKAIVH
jgi:hypothetical protein